MKIYLVGGAVRDKILGRVVKDHDWVVVGATPAEMLAANFQQVGRDFPVFLHPETGEEYALARLERKTGPGHQGFTFDVSKTVTLVEDLSRRDLTINAMAQDSNGQLIDPYAGQQDCQQQLLRHVSPAFVEDPLRCLRVARFAAQLPGFTVAPETMLLMQKMVAANELATLSKPRIWQEWFKALQFEHFADFLAVLAAMRAWDSWKIVWHQSWLALPFQSLVPEARFALLLSHMPQEAQAQLFTVLAPAKRYQDWAVMLHQTTLLCDTWPDLWQADHFMMLFDSIDAFRRPERLPAWQAMASQDPRRQGQLAAIEHTAAVFTVASSRQAREVLAQGYTGKAVGEQLDRLRRQAIASYLAK